MVPLKMKKKMKILEVVFGETREGLPQDSTQQEENEEF